LRIYQNRRWPTRPPLGPNHGPIMFGPRRPLQTVAAAAAALPAPTTPRSPPRRPPYSPPTVSTTSATASCGYKGSALPMSSPFSSSYYAHAHLCFSLCRANADCRTPVHRAPPPPATTLPDHRLLELHPGAPLQPFQLQPRQPLRPINATPPRSTRVAADSPLQPLFSRFDHTPITAPPSMTSPHRELPTTTLDTAPTVILLRSTTHRHGAHSSGEDLPVPTPQMGAPRCRAALAPLLHRPRCWQARADWAAASAVVGRAPSPVYAEMGHQPKWLGQPKTGRPVSARLHSATCHFSIRLKID
jgi:hypothetical protein